MLEAFELVVEELGGFDGHAVSTGELRDGLKSLKVLESRVSAQIARLTHVADQRAAWVGTGSRDTAEWLGAATGTSTKKNRAATALGAAMADSDELADAVASGHLSSEKAAAAVGAAGGGAIDQELLDQLADVSLNNVRPTTEQWRSQKRPDEEADRAQRRRAKRYLTLTDVDDGMTRVDGLLDPASASIVKTTLDSIISESAFDESGRSREQRRADALTQLSKAASKGNITGGRSNARVLVTSSYDTVCERGATPGRSHAGTMVDAAAVRQMCCDAGMHRVISGPGSSILDFGHENRLVSDNLFLALVARDQHCRWPGCTIPATWCDAHHITEWQHGGRTAEDTCALFCDYHHSVLHLPGWQVIGDAHRFEIHHPDGTVHVGTPPPPVGHAGSRSPATSVERPDPPPDGPASRADHVGRETSTADVLDSLQATVRQLELV